MTRSALTPLMILGPWMMATPIWGCGDDTGGRDDVEVADTAQPDTAQPDTAQPDTAQPDTAPDTGLPDTDLPDTAQPDAAPDTDLPDTNLLDTEPDSAQPDTTETTPTNCVIEGVTYARDTRDPANACAACVPETSTSTWTPSVGTIALFDGALEHTAQGWAIAESAPLEASIVDGALRLATSTPPGASTGGLALLWRALPLPAGSPFTFEVDLSLERAATHNAFDAGAAILMAYTPLFGQGAERAQMIYLEPDKIGWADDSSSAALNLGDAETRTFRISVDADRFARVAVDGVELLTRDGVTNNGQIAIGDQTNDPGVDGAMKIRAVRLLCP